MGNIEIMNKLFNILKQSINKNLLVKGKVNDKKFSYDEKGHKEAISYATKLMQSKKPVNFKWHEENYAEKDLKKLRRGTMSALAGWWLGGTLNELSRGLGEPTPAQQREYERQIQESSRRNGRKINKQSAIEKMRSFFQKDSNDTYVRKIPFKK